LQRSESTFDVIGDGREIDERGVVIVSRRAARARRRCARRRPAPRAPRADSRSVATSASSSTTKTLVPASTAARGADNGAAGGFARGQRIRKIAPLPGPELRARDHPPRPEPQRARASGLRRRHPGDALTPERQSRLPTGAPQALRPVPQSPSSRPRSRLDDDATATRTPSKSVQQHIGEHLRSVRGKRQPDHRTARRYDEHDTRAMGFDREGFNRGFDDGVKRFFVLVDGALSADGPVARCRAPRARNAPRSRACDRAAPGRSDPSEPLRSNRVRP
jgi:hypothetical protein